LKFWDEEEIGKKISLRAWRPFGSAQDMLGATTFFVTSVESKSVRDKFSDFGV
jgi:hypothetical protein